MLRDHAPGVRELLQALNCSDQALHHEARVVW